MTDDLLFWAFSAGLLVGWALHALVDALYRWLRNWARRQWEEL